MEPSGELVRQIPSRSASPSDFDAAHEFVEAHVRPHADRWDLEAAIPEELIRGLASEGFLAAMVPDAFGGAGSTMRAYGSLTEEVGRACSSTRSLLTVHGMVCTAISRWGSATQKERLLPRLAAGDLIGALAVSERAAGSDLAAVGTRLSQSNGDLRLDGSKAWITFGQRADLFLVLARADEGPVAVLVERSRPGVGVRPIPPMLGTRATMQAEIDFETCEVSRDDLVGRAGFGLSAVIATALDNGRFSVACGCVGIAEASLQASIEYATRREQFGSPLAEHQLIQRRISETAVWVEAARLLCQRAADARDEGRREAVLQTSKAKYFASRAAFLAASHAVQIHGAVGCEVGSSIERYFRDARVMEIIEGSTEMQEIMIARQMVGSHRASGRR